LVKTWLYVFLAVAVDGCAGLVGGLLKERWLIKWRPILLGFAAGVLLGTAFLDLLPEALKQSAPPVVVGVVLASVAVMAVLQRALGDRGRPVGTSGGRLAVRLLGADALHNAADGAAIAAAFVVSPRLGVVTAVAVIAHELPEELADYVLLRRGGLSRAGTIAALMVVQFTAAIGAAGMLISATSWQRISGIVLGVATGTFVYIATFDLLPDLLRGRDGQRSRLQGAFGLVVGVALSVVECLW
jgi:zinc and cadmium transporter